MTMSPEPFFESWIPEASGLLGSLESDNTNHYSSHLGIQQKVKGRR